MTGHDMAMPDVVVDKVVATSDVATAMIGSVAALSSAGSVMASTASSTAASAAAASGATAAAVGVAVWLPLFLHFLLLSLLSIGGAVSTAPDMHRVLVAERHWLSDADFGASLALAQAAPGPNVLFVAVLGWKIAGWMGVVATMLGMLLPSTVLSLAASRWAARRRHTRGVRAFTSGMAPLTVGLLCATAWLLGAPVVERPGACLLALGAALAVARTRIAPLWLVLVGAVVGSLGWC